MEKIKVNMSPNPLDVQTIHASQNDGEARQWEFELHNNGDVIDASEITDQMVFKAYKGGTEQILPENTSTPTTSPFLGDIRYPQGLLTDQEFLYRESPTEEDGLAKITDIKGNTLVWNQLVQNGNFENTSGWTVVRGTLSASSNVLSYTVDVLGGGGLQNRILCSVAIPAGHKVYISVSIKATKPFAFLANANGEFYLKNPITANEWNLCQAIRTVSTGMENLVFGCPSNIGDMAVGDVIQFKNVMLVDLTKMGLDYITDPSDFASLFPLPYYAYNQGTLLSFNGNGIKTVGKNLFDENSVLLSQGFVKQNDGSYYKDNLATLNAIVWSNDAHINGTINIKYKYKNISTAGSQGLRIIVLYTDGARHTVYSPVSLEFTLLQHQTESSRMVDKILWDYGSSTNSTYIKDFIISVDNISYEPYTSSTLSLPISTYFPTGMKSAGSVYDELTSNKAITRIKVLDLGTIDTSGWQYFAGRSNFYTVIPDMAVPVNANTKANAKCKIGVPITWNEMLANHNENGTYAITQVGTEKRFYIKNTNYSSVTDFMQYVNGLYLYYELATPTETSFTTASLVTENAEIPLSNEDGVLIGKCTEQLSENPGFIDAKIKLTDSDGECYSNKLQLHVERSPQ